MALKKTVYKRPSEGMPLIEPIVKGAKSPILEVRFCNLLKAFQFPNSPGVDRYSITCAIDPVADLEYQEYIEKLEKKEGVESALKNELRKEPGGSVFTGRVLIKFQAIVKVPIYQIADGETTELTLQDEFQQGEKVQVEYDIMRYTKRDSTSCLHGMSFKLIKVFHYKETA